MKVCFIAIVLQNYHESYLVSEICHNNFVFKIPALLISVIDYLCKCHTSFCNALIVAGDSAKYRATPTIG